MRRPVCWILAALGEALALRFLLGRAPSWPIAAFCHLLSSALVGLSCRGEAAVPAVDGRIRAGAQAACVFLLPGLGFLPALCLGWLRRHSRRRGAVAAYLDYIASRMDARGGAPSAEAEIAARIRDRMDVQAADEITDRGDFWLKRRAMDRLAKTVTPRAVRILKRLLQDPHPEIQFHAARILSAMQDRLNEEARSAEVQAARDPASASARALLGARYFDYVYLGLLDPVARGFYLDLAVEALSGSVALDPLQPKVLVRLGRALIDRGECERAVRNLDLALGMEPGSVSTLLWRAEARFGQGDLDGAIADARAASDRGAVPEAMQETLRWLTTPSR